MVDERAEALARLEQALAAIGPALAVFLVYDRPTLVGERPALARTHFAERCATDEQVNETISAYRDIGAYVELFDDERSFVSALANDRLVPKAERRFRVVENGVGFGITDGGFQPGRMALVPAIADAYSLACGNSDAYTSAFSMHRYHSFLVFEALGIPAPPVWHFNPEAGWMGDPPPVGEKVIVKSTYEAWSVGVTADSVFVAGSDLEDRLHEIAQGIGQPVTLQRFIAGREVCIPLVETPRLTAMPAVEQILARAPSDPDAIFTIDDNLGTGAVEYVPFDGARETIAQMEAAAKRVFAITQQRGVGRMDFRIDADGRPWLTDAAIVPGVSRASSFFAAVQSLGFSHPQFLRICLGASILSYGWLDLVVP